MDTLVRIQRENLLGHATWEWDQELGLHIPVCSRWKLSRNGQNVVRCGNGPLNDSQLETGTCSEGPHLEPHEFDGRRPQVYPVSDSMPPLRQERQCPSG